MWEAHVSLQQACVAAFSVTVQEQNDGPLLAFIPIRGKIDLVAIHIAADNDGAIEESGLGLTRGYWNCERSYD
jgi:hypothetical protein